MFLNDTSFSLDRISMLSHLLTHLNPSTNENLLLAISDLTRLEMGLDKSSIDYMSRVPEYHTKCKRSQWKNYPTL